MVNNPLRDEDIDPLREPGRIQPESIDIPSVIRHWEHPKQFKTFTVKNIMQKDWKFQGKSTTQRFFWKRY